MFDSIGKIVTNEKRKKEPRLIGAKLKTQLEMLELIVRRAESYFREAYRISHKHSDFDTTDINARFYYTLRDYCTNLAKNIEASLPALETGKTKNLETTLRLAERKFSEHLSFFSKQQPSYDEYIGAHLAEINVQIKLTKDLFNRFERRKIA